MTMFTRRSILKAAGAATLVSSQGLLPSKAFAGDRDDQLNISVGKAITQRRC